MTETLLKSTLNRKSSILPSKFYVVDPDHCWFTIALQPVRVRAALFSPVLLPIPLAMIRFTLMTSNFFTGALTYKETTFKSGVI